MAKLQRRHRGVNSLQYTAGENLALQFRGGDTVRGNKRAVDISRHRCISRNLLLLRGDKMTGRCVSARESRIKKSKWIVERQSSAAARSQCFLHNVKQVLLCILHASAGELRESEERRIGEGGREDSSRRRSWSVSTQCRPALLKHAARTSPYTTKTRALVCQHWRNQSANTGSG